MDTIDTRSIDAPASAELASQDPPATGPSDDNSSRKRSREPEAPANALDTSLAAADDANPTKRSRNDEGPATVNDYHGGKDEPINADDEQSAAAAAEGAGANADQPTLSKNQLRKQRRQQKFDERREARKQIRKDKRQEKSARKREDRNAEAEELAQRLGIDMDEALKRVQEEKHRQAKKNANIHRPVPISIIIDCDFEKYMRDNELVSLASQVTRSYAMNRGGTYMAHLLVSSWGGKMRERFETVLNSHHLQWKGVSFVEDDFVEAGKVAWDIMHSPRGGKLCPALGETSTSVQKVPDEKPTSNEAPLDQASKDGEAQSSVAQLTEVECKGTDKVKDDLISEEASEAGPKLKPGNKLESPPFSADSIVYLSADSPHTLDRLEPNTSYVIGGLVDRNREKHLCQRRAEEKGIRTAKLPIGEYLQMSSRKVLATNHVVEIMSKWLETGDWAQAFLEVIPKRKGGQLKNGEGGEDQKDDDKDGDDVEDEDDQEMVDAGDGNVRASEE
ncbi:unnamed protein product [Discula destructiva]